MLTSCTDVSFSLKKAAENSSVRADECGGLENRCAARHPGFESLSLRWKELQNKKNPCKLILYRDFLFLVHGKNKHIKAFFRLSSFLVGIIFYTREVLLTHSFHLKRISVGNRRKSIACVINKNERNLASTI